MIEDCIKQRAYTLWDVAASRAAYEAIEPGALYIEDLLLLAAQQAVQCGDEADFLATARVAWNVVETASRQDAKIRRVPGRQRRS